MNDVQRILIALHSGSGPEAFAALHDATEESGLTAHHPRPSLLCWPQRDPSNRPGYFRLCMELPGGLEYATSARKPASVPPGAEDREYFPVQ